MSAMFSLLIATEKSLAAELCIFLVTINSKLVKLTLKGAIYLDAFFAQRLSLFLNYFCEASRGFPLNGTGFQLDY